MHRARRDGVLLLIVRHHDKPCAVSSNHYPAPRYHITVAFTRKAEEQQAICICHNSKRKYSQPGPSRSSSDRPSSALPGIM
jgi:hypothetical protein